MLPGARAAARFSLLQLEEGEDYVMDWGARVTWPRAVPGRWATGAGAGPLPARLRLGSKNLFLEPEDVRVPIVRCLMPHSPSPTTNVPLPALSLAPII